MSYLLAQGPQLENRWRRALPESDAVLLGRSTAQWQVTWDASMVFAARALSGETVAPFAHA